MAKDKRTRKDKAIETESRVLEALLGLLDAKGCELSADVWFPSGRHWTMANDSEGSRVHLVVP